MSQIKRLVKEGIWIIIGQITAVAGALVLVRVLTEYLEPAQYGQLALGLTVAGLVNQVVMGGIIAGIGRYYSIAAETQDLGGYLHATRHLLACATVAVVVIGLILMPSLYWLGYSKWMGMATAALVFSVVSGYNNSLSGIQNAARQRAIVAFHGGLDAWLKILLAVGAVLWLGSSSTAVIIGYASSSLLITLSQLIFLHRTIPPQQYMTIQNSRQWVQQIWVFSLPFNYWGAFTWLQQVSDRWALQIFATTSDVGQYAVLFQLGFYPISLITGMAMSFLGPIMYQRSGDATDQDRNTNVHRIGWSVTQITLAITLLGFMFTFALHKWLFGMLVAPVYRGSTVLLPWVVLAGGIFAAGQMLALKLMSDMKSSLMKRAKIITALIGILLNVVGASLYGLYGVVWAMVIFSGIYFIWMSMLASRLAVRPDCDENKIY